MSRDRAAPAARGRGRTFLVTGAFGCIGAWTVRALIERGHDVVIFDSGKDDSRLRLLVPEEDLARVPHIRGDVRDIAQLTAALEGHAVTNVIHLAALQVPFCRADPTLGASVNVVGTINVLEASRRHFGRTSHVVYASSIAAYDVAPDDDGRAGAGPATLYGVFKRANEASAAIYFDDYELSSIGLRPHTVYGVGRDQGITSAPTFAMLAAAGGGTYEIPFSGSVEFQHAADVANSFVDASLIDYVGASVHNLPGEVATMQELINTLESVVSGASSRIACVGGPLPFPASVDSSSLFTLAGMRPKSRTLAEGVRATVGHFRELLESGRMSADGTLPSKD